MKKKEFFKWLNSQLCTVQSKSIVAFCFNLYESFDCDGQYDVQVVGCSTFDSDNDDWACKTVFSSGENLFSFEANDWEDALEIFGSVLNETIESNQFETLLVDKHIAYGFVDGDLIIIK